MLKKTKVRQLWLVSAAALLLTSPAHAQLDSILGAAKASTAASSAAQRSVEQSDDRAESAIREYRAVLQQIDNIKLFVAQQDIFLQSQQAEIDSLNNQLSTVEQIKQGMVPMMLRMATNIEDVIKSDVPFLLEERLERVARLKETLSDPDISPAEQYRQVLNAYKIEVSYGQGLDSYEGAHPTKPGNVVNFLRFGRVSYVYMSKDEQDIARYDLANQSWEQISGDQAVALRRAIRIAHGEAAPGIVFAPVVAN